MSEVEGISQLVLDAQNKPVVLEAPEGRTFVALPQGGGAYKLEQITSPNKADVLMPKVVIQAVQLQTTPSLIDYVNRFKNADTMLFADIANNTIVGIIDYHGEPKINPDDTYSPAIGRLNNHRATLKLPFSQEWVTWSGMSGQLMSHVDFASFLEENSIDVVTPNGATLLEMCRDLQVKSGVNFNSSVREGDYSSIEYQKGDDVSTKDNIKLPVSIALEIPVYFGEKKVKINAFMRRKIVHGALTLGYVLSRAENVRQDEFHEIVEGITVNVDHLTTVYGKPA